MYTLVIMRIVYLCLHKQDKSQIILEQLQFEKTHVIV